MWVPTVCKRGTARLEARRALVGRADPSIPYARLPMDLEGATPWGMITGAAEQAGHPMPVLEG